MRHLATVGIMGLILCSSPMIMASDKEQEIAAIKKAGVTVSQAVQKLEKKYRAVAVEAEVESWRDMIVYEVELIDREAKRKIEIKLDMTSGEVLKEEISSIASWFEGDDKKELAMDAVVKKRFGLFEAIVFAKRYVTGHVYEAELEREKGITFVKIKVLTPTGKEKVIVDVETRSIIPVLKRR